MADINSTLSFPDWPQGDELDHRLSFMDSKDWRGFRDALTNIARQSDPDAPQIEATTGCMREFCREIPDDCTYRVMALPRVVTFDRPEERREYDAIIVEPRGDDPKGAIVLRADLCPERWRFLIRTCTDVLNLLRSGTKGGACPMCGKAHKISAPLHKHVHRCCKAHNIGSAWTLNHIEKPLPVTPDLMTRRKHIANIAAMLERYATTSYVQMAEGITGSNAKEGRLKLAKPKAAPKPKRTDPADWWKPEAERDTLDDDDAGGDEQAA